MKTKKEIKNQFMGSVGWLIFWIIIFWPIAIIYYFASRKPTKINIIEEK